MPPGPGVSCEAVSETDMNLKILDRRGFLKTVAATQTLTLRAAPQPAPMVPWIFMHSPLERWLEDDYKGILDAWHEGGVRGIAIGYMNFVQPNGSSIPTYQADPRVYRAAGLTPPPDAPRDPVKEKRLHAMLDDIRNRGWDVHIFASIRGGGGKTIQEDPYGAISFGAGVQDMMNAYPQAQGIILDGPGEHHYELAFHHGGEVFELRQWERQRYAALGMDVARMEKGIAHLRARFPQPDPVHGPVSPPGGAAGRHGAVRPGPGFALLAACAAGEHPGILRRDQGRRSTNRAARRSSRESRALPRFPS